MQDVFVGRVPELALLEDAAAEAAGGRGRLVLVAGEPGIGKSRLADEFARRATDAGVLVAWGRCWELGGAPAYWPWTEALRAVIARRRTDPGDELGQLVPELQRTAAEAAPEHADSARFRLFEAVVQFLRTTTADQPIVIVLEDLHAADEPSLLLLQYVVRAAANLRLLVIATYRDVELADDAFTAALSELLRDLSTARVVLVGLNATDVGEMIAATTGETASNEVVERVRSHTEGNPLYVREVARLLTAEGRLPEAGDRLPVPRDVREVVLRRIRRLPADCRDVLTLAAVIGRDFPLDLMTRMRGDEAVEQLEPAMQAGLIVTGEPGQMRFSHAVVSEALYDATSPALRLQLHCEIAETIDKHHAANIDPHVASIAHHYLLALPFAPAEKAVLAAQRAAQAAVARLAYEEGARLFRNAIEASRSGDDEQVAVELLLGLGDALGRAGETDESKATFLDATARLRDMDAPQLFAQAALGYAGRFVWARAADDSRLVPLLREALDRLPRDDSVQRVKLLARLSGALRDEAARAPREALSLEAVRAAERLDDPAVLAYALPARWWAIWGPDTAEELRDLAAAAIVNAERCRERERLGDALIINMLACTMFGEADAARELLARYHAIGEELGQPSIRWYAMVMHSVMLLGDGRISQADDAIELARAMGREVQPWDADASYRMAITMLRWEQGRLRDVEDLVANATTRFPGYRVFRCLLALVYIETGRGNEAGELVEEILRAGADTLPPSNDWLPGMTLLAEIAHRLAMTGVAAAMYEAMLPYGHLVGTVGGEPFTGSMQRPLGQMAELLGDLDGARQHYEHALEVHTRMRLELWIAHSEYDIAELLRLQSRTADPLLARSLHRCETLGMTALAGRIRTTLGREPGTGPRPGGLTRRELEVAALVAAGASNREIADKLVISERTAESHVQNILTKLGFGSRAQIASWATAEGLGAAT